MPKSEQGRSGRIRVAIIDDHPMFRTGLVATLRRFSDLEVVGVGANADEAIEVAKAGKIDILLLDIGIPGNGIEAGRRIAHEFSSVQVMYLTGSNSEEDAASAFASGGRGYVLKGATGRELANAIRTVHQGDLYVTPELGSRMLAQRGAASRPPEPARRAPLELNAGEKEVLDLATQGKKNHEIAAQLGVSVATVKYRIAQIVRKLGVQNRVEAIVIHSQSKDRERATSRS